MTVDCRAILPNPKPEQFAGRVFFDAWMRGQPLLLPPPTHGNIRRRRICRPKVLPGLKRRIAERDRGVCQLCGHAASPISIDHIVPVVFGGATNDVNLRLACGGCNGAHFQRTFYWLWADTTTEAPSDWRRLG